MKLTHIYKEFLGSIDLHDKFFRKFDKLASEVDSRIDNKLKTLFLISLYCNVFYHIYGNRKKQLKKQLTWKPKIRCNKFTIFTYDSKKTDILLRHLVSYFNTDAINILPITSLIVDDLNNMSVYMKNV